MEFKLTINELHPNTFQRYAACIQLRAEDDIRFAGFKDREVVTCQMLADHLNGLSDDCKTVAYILDIMLRLAQYGMAGATACSAPYVEDCAVSANLEHRVDLVPHQPYATLFLRLNLTPTYTAAAKLDDPFHFHVARVAWENGTLTHKIHTMRKIVRLINDHRKSYTYLHGLYEECARGAMLDSNSWWGNRRTFRDPLRERMTFGGGASIARPFHYLDGIGVVADPNAKPGTVMIVGDTLSGSSAVAYNVADPQDERK